MTFDSDDLEELAALVADDWRQAADRDWSVNAGPLEWSCAKTADHIVDTVLAPAFFLASRKVDDYPAGGWSPGERASPHDFAEALETAARIVVAVVRATDPDVRAIIWRRPTVEARPPADFAPRAALELILHAHDVAAGLDIDFAPPTGLCERLRAHTRHWPFWTAVPGWSPLMMEGDAFDDLLRSSGRLSP